VSATTFRVRAPWDTTLAGLIPDGPAQVLAVAGFGGVGFGGRGGRADGGGGVDADGVAVGVEVGDNV
jgi:hypothetical protein